MSRQPTTPAASAAQPSLDSSFLPLTSAGDDVSFPLVEDHGHTGEHTREAEEALEALRVAIAGAPHDAATAGHDVDGGVTGAGDGSESTPTALQAPGVGVGVTGEDMTQQQHPTLFPASQVQSQSLDKAVAAIQQLSTTSQTIIDNMNAPALLTSLLGSFKVLVDSNRRQTELVKNLIDSVQGRGPPTVDPTIAVSYVPRSEYDALKARYDALLSTSTLGSSSGPSRRRANKTAVADDSIDPNLSEVGSMTPTGEEDKRAGGRRRRPMKLEHLVHKMANRRLGVSYTISGFECKGNTELPSPDEVPPVAATSVNGIDEMRPDFRSDVTADSVRPYIETVVEDVRAAWPEVAEVGDTEPDKDQVVKATHTYWTRLMKRYDEQLARDRGEVHKDELTRRKQNQYRRQQSLVARRVAAFDSSPLNHCKLRALYRTLLTIDFAAQTNERPDPKREYTEDEWNAYRKQQCGARANDAHEVVDQFWLSPTARTLLTILDAYATDMATKQRKKGRPKTPAPTFHLPAELWDRSTLPILRPKDPHGLPIPNAGGIILFRFHVDEKVQQDFPDWAQGLYDNPPIAEEDRLLPNLSDVMNATAFHHLKPKVKASRDAMNVTRLSPVEVHDMLTRTDDDGNGTPSILEEAGVHAVAAAAAAAADPDASFDYTSSDFMSRGLESIVALASSQLMNPFATPGASTSTAAHHPLHLGALGGLDIPVSPAGPSPGSSVRARKQAKRMMTEPPGGAATPVAKKRKAGETEPDADLTGDASFLDNF